MAPMYAPQDVVVDGVDVQFAAGLFNIVANELESAGHTR